MHALCAAALPGARLGLLPSVLLRRCILHRRFRLWLLMWLLRLRLRLLKPHLGAVHANRMGAGCTSLANGTAEVLPTPITCSATRRIASDSCWIGSGLSGAGASSRHRLKCPLTG